MKNTVFYANKLGSGGAVFLVKRGFTLIELLIVIAIIGILAGVILVSTSSARQKAQIASGRQTLKSMMPYVASCLVSNRTINTNTTAGGAICVGDASGGNYPAVPTGCGTITASQTQLNATCGNTNINCNALTGACN